MTKDKPAIKVDADGDIKIELKALNIQDVVVKAITEALDKEQRTLLLESALRYVITPRKKYVGSTEQKSPLQEAFERAIEQVAFEEAKKFFADGSEGHKQLQDVIVKGYEEWLKMDKIELAGQIASRISAAFNRW